MNIFHRFIIKTLRTSRIIKYLLIPVYVFKFIAPFYQYNRDILSI